MFVNKADAVKVIEERIAMIEGIERQRSGNRDSSVARQLSLANLRDVLREIEALNQKPALPIEQMVLVHLDRMYASKCPERAYENDAGFDLFAATSVDVPPRSVRDVPTGVRLALPSGIGARITGRSSTIRREGVWIVEGIVDQGYRGEILFGVFNPSPDMHYRVLPGAKLAQLIPFHIPKIGIAVVDDIKDLPLAERGERGFGSSGA